MKISCPAFEDHGFIPDEFAFCIPDARSHVTLGGNRNPPLVWSELPPGTRSIAIICHDPDVPSRGDDVNQVDRTVPADLPRVDFFHWVLVDLPASITSVLAGEYSSAVVPRGKAGPEAPHGARQGINDYTAWFAGDPDMRGDYYGYDGPCPPWNDEIVHRYVFTVFALDIEHVAVAGRFGGLEARAAIAGHVIGQVSITGRFSLNPAVRP